MPRNRSKSNSNRTDKGASAKPYARSPTTPSSSATAPNGSSKFNLTPSSSSHSIEMAESPVTKLLTSAKKRRRKLRRQTSSNALNQVDTADSEAEADGSANLSLANGARDKSPKKESFTPEEVLSRYHASRDAQLVTTTAQSALNREQIEHRETRRQLREAQEKVKNCEREVQQAHTQLLQRIKELEDDLELQKAEVTKQRVDIECKTKLITDQTKNHDDVKDGLSCSVCFDIYDDPHVLSCGHAACRSCLVQWFRSGNAYRGQDIEVVLDGDDLSFRTKLCFTCRDPVIRRPIRMFALKSIIDTLGLAATKNEEERNDDPWALTFPADPTSYLIADEADSVDRCPACGCEVAGGFCTGCDANFSDEDYDSSFEDLDDSDDEHNVQDGVLYPRFVARAGEGMFVQRGPDEDFELAEYDGPNMSLIDDLADESGDDDDMEDSDDSVTREGAMWSPAGSPGDLQPHGVYGNSDNEDDVDFGGRQFSPPGPRRTRGIRDRRTVDLRSHSPIRRNRRAIVEEEEEEEDYESSFIDDEERMDEAQVDATFAMSEAESEPDKPSIDELRQRRAARFASPPADPGPPARTTRRARRVIASDSESE